MRLVSQTLKIIKTVLVRIFRIFLLLILVLTIWGGIYDAWYAEEPNPPLKKLHYVEGDAVKFDDFYSHEKGMPSLGNDEGMRITVPINGKNERYEISSRFLWLNNTDYLTLRKRIKDELSASKSKKIRIWYYKRGGLDSNHIGELAVEDSILISYKTIQADWERSKNASLDDSLYFFLIFLGFGLYVTGLLI